MSKENFSWKDIKKMVKKRGEDLKLGSFTSAILSLCPGSQLRDTTLTG